MSAIQPPSNHHSTPNHQPASNNPPPGNNEATWFITNKTTSWLTLLILLIGGLIAYMQLGRLEDPPFTIKEAMVVVYYPGASPAQVEEEVTARLEDAIQSLAYVDDVDSISRAGMSQIHLKIKTGYRSSQLPQIWDELRRKVNDKASSLPTGTSAPVVLDNFGDVYGMLLAVSGEGFSYPQLNDYAEYLKRELVTADGVSSIDIAGDQNEVVFITISREQLNNLGIPLTRLYSLLQSRNAVVAAGSLRTGDEQIRIYPFGEFTSVEELGDLLISQPGSDRLIRLRDIATVSRGVSDNPTHFTGFNGQPALHLGIAFRPGVNVVEAGAALRRQIAALDSTRPLGMELHTIYDQPAEVAQSSDGFILNLALSVLIVIAVLLVFMGLRPGLIIGAILLLTILGTLIVMKALAIDLHRISLGALIIALGMLVDNALVITEGIMIGLQRGQSRLYAAWAIVHQTRWPLLGATVIAIVAFAPIGLSPDDVGEFVGSLFYVLLISLLISWFTALTLTPFLCDLLLKAPVPTTNSANHTEADPYAGVLYQAYKTLLQTMLHHRVLTSILMIVLLGAAVLGFTQVKQSFFPPSNTPMFLVDLWLPEGTDLQATRRQAEQLEHWYQNQSGVEYTSSSSGRGDLRFMLTYAVEKEYAAYAQVMVRADSLDSIPPLIRAGREYGQNNMADAQLIFRRLQIGPGTPAKIEARFSGPDPQELRRLANEAEAILHADTAADNIRHNWRQRVKVIRPHLNEENARRAGVTREDLDNLLQLTYSGRTVGVYREGTHQLGIVLRLPEHQRSDIDGLSGLQIWSPVYNRYIPLQQVVEQVDVVFEDPLVLRLNRKRTLQVLADPALDSGQTADELFRRVRPQIEAIALPAGYQLEWGGEYESSRKAQANVFASLPMGYLLMFVITILLFNEVRSALVIWACVPLAIIGVSAGMLLLRAEFGFMALLGFLSLSGMIVKNGIVLVDQIRLEEQTGKPGYQALCDAAVSRLRPVSMAALTTILGMLPLLIDPFFSAMAVVITFGLGFATVLTLGVVPVLYSFTHRIQVQRN
ncbi:efflux RND transporter permease subunit [Parathalassolituus penaei]|uniref:Efflux RND transporter permease subunit n=1 Tax=Parathalassolituus penaei TaxID=2997323 RepID=A0A9X3EB77_9GAMM|nr:efflux RND transporter permease subunit [Parathalassolituus penaei]MCY0964035.1 efflux RND transporter permease subunit [Parathalassolituus penaei]